MCMRSLTRRQLTRVVLLLAVLGVLGYLSVVVHGQVVEKEAWTILQATEFHHRNDPEKGSPLLLEHEGGSKYVLLGLPSGVSDFPRDWLILNAIPGGAI